ISITPSSLGIEITDHLVSTGYAIYGTKIVYGGIVYTVLKSKTKKYLCTRDSDGSRFNVPFLGSKAFKISPENTKVNV
ncbi:hypothetical protein, partial [Listeria monocytogenes]|uniref:hypothetical protein n=1 Tax=Listeria monocytogenes TaxID=1639 RepID=UPI002FDBA763